MWSSLPHAYSAFAVMCSDVCIQLFPVFWLSRLFCYWLSHLFCYWLSRLFWLSPKSGFYVPDTSPLSDKQLTNIFSPSVAVFSLSSVAHISVVPKQGRPSSVSRGAFLTYTDTCTHTHTHTHTS